MVVILTGEVPSERSAVGRALAAAVGWRFEDASRDDVHDMAARALGRREQLVIAGPSPDREPREIIHRDLRQVRFVQLRRGLSDDQPFPDLAIDSTQPIGAMVAAIRREFGI